MANSRSAPQPATLWPCWRIWTRPQPVVSPSSLPADCRRSELTAGASSLGRSAPNSELIPQPHLGLTTQVVSDRLCEIGQVLPGPVFGVVRPVTQVEHIRGHDQPA